MEEWRGNVSEKRKMAGKNTTKVHGWGTQTRTSMKNSHTYEVDVYIECMIVFEWPCQFTKDPKTRLQKKANNEHEQYASEPKIQEKDEEKGKDKNLWKRMLISLESVLPPVRVGLHRQDSWVLCGGLDLGSKGSGTFFFLFSLRLKDAFYMLTFTICILAYTFDTFPICSLPWYNRIEISKYFGMSL